MKPLGWSGYIGNCQWKGCNKPATTYTDHTLVLLDERFWCDEHGAIVEAKQDSDFLAWMKKIEEARPENIIKRLQLENENLRDELKSLKK